MVTRACGTLEAWAGGAGWWRAGSPPRERPSRIHCELSQAGPPGVRSPAEGMVEGQGANRARGPAPGKPLGLTGQEVDEGNVESTHCSKGTGVEGEPACLEDGQRGEEGFGVGTGRFWKRGALSGCWTSRRRGTWPSRAQPRVGENLDGSSGSPGPEVWPVCTLLGRRGF